MLSRSARGIIHRTARIETRTAEAFSRKGEGVTVDRGQAGRCARLTAESFLDGWCPELFVTFSPYGIAMVMPSDYTPD